MRRKRSALLSREPRPALFPKKISGTIAVRGMRRSACLLFQIQFSLKGESDASFETLSQNRKPDPACKWRRPGEEMSDFRSDLHRLL